MQLQPLSDPMHHKRVSPVLIERVLANLQHAPLQELRVTARNQRLAGVLVMWGAQREL
jgi:hypothetical protein